MKNQHDRPELGGVFVAIGAVGGALMGIQAGTTGEEALVGGLVGLVVGAGIGRIVERVLFKMFVLGFTLLMIYLRLKAWGIIE
jgi:hypothetical protein